MSEYRQLEDFTSVRPILSKISFLGGLTEGQLDSLLKHLMVGTFTAQEVIAKEGEEPSYIYIIQQGSVHLSITDGDRRVNKRVFALGESFGEAALLSMVNNTASFVAAEDCRLIAFSRKSLGQLRKDEPELFTRLILNMARDLARKLQYSDEILLRSEA